VAKFIVVVVIVALVFTCCEDSVQTIRKITKKIIKDINKKKIKKYEFKNI